MLNDTLFRLGLTGLLSLSAAAVLSSTANADSISPSSFSGTLKVGETITFKKTVEITKGLPSGAKADVFFLSDTTGSMDAVIDGVRTNASSILSSTSSLGDIQFGVGEYKDEFDPFIYRTNTALTNNTTAVQSGISEWNASGGGDFPEGNLYALKQVADTTAWRPDSKRVLVWFGDAPGNDPSKGITEAEATAALTGKNIAVEAVDNGNLDLSGQATRITDATGGNLFTLDDADSISTVIQNAIAASFANYTSVTLDSSAAPSGLDVTISPAGGFTGTFDRSVTRTFDFNISITGLVAGNYNFGVKALLDGGLVATEADNIRVISAVPVPAALPMLMSVLAPLTWSFRRKSAKAA